MAEETWYEEQVCAELRRRGIHHVSQDPLKEEEFVLLQYRLRMDIWIPDMYRISGGFAVEVDGNHHYVEPQLSKDRERTTRLQMAGITVIRISNRAVLQNVVKVVDSIVETMKGSNS